MTAWPDLCGSNSPVRSTTLCRVGTRGRKSFWTTRTGRNGSTGSAGRSRPAAGISMPSPCCPTMTTSSSRRPSPTSRRACSTLAAAMKATSIAATGRSGHLFQGRFRGHLIEEEHYFIEVSRYIHLNPVRAKIVVRPEPYPWSSSCGQIIGPTSKLPENTDFTLAGSMQLRRPWGRHSIGNAR